MAMYGVTIVGAHVAGSTFFAPKNLFKIIGVSGMAKIMTHKFLSRGITPKRPEAIPQA
jgi:hypothetical protein